ncbi:hypothetical protein C8R46DRAFT_885043, partial [Mycena filopes]
MARCCTVFAHQPTADCGCDNCEDFREDVGCKNPHACYTKARELLNKLPFKWDPRREQPEDYEIPAEQEDDDGWITFDGSVTTSGSLKEIFRIFTDGAVTNTPPD